jgi:thiol-disulfide isomerase/thioredoxin
LADLNDNPHSLKLHRGKVIVINLWAIWCSPCREELPTLEAA